MRAKLSGVNCPVAEGPTIKLATTFRYDASVIIPLIYHKWPKRATPAFDKRRKV